MKVFVKILLILGILLLVAGIGFVGYGIYKKATLKLSLNCKKDHCIYLAMISDEKFLFIFLFLKL